MAFKPLIRWLALAIAIAILILCVYFARNFPSDYIWLWMMILMVTSFIIFMLILEMILSCIPCQSQGPRSHPLCITLGWILLLSLLILTAGTLVFIFLSATGPMIIGGLCLALGILLLLQFICKARGMCSITPVCPHCQRFHSPFAFLQCRRDSSHVTRAPHIPCDPNQPCRIVRCKSHAINKKPSNVGACNCPQTSSRPNVTPYRPVTCPGRPATSHRSRQSCLYSPSKNYAPQVESKINEATYTICTQHREIEIDSICYIDDYGQIDSAKSATDDYCRKAPAEISNDYCQIDSAKRVTVDYCQNAPVASNDDYCQIDSTKTLTDDYYQSGSASTSTNTFEQEFQSQASTEIRNQTLNRPKTQPQPEIRRNYETKTIQRPKTESNIVRKEVKQTTPSHSNDNLPKYIYISSYRFRKESMNSSED